MKLCRGMCKDRTHILYEWFDDLTNVLWGTSLPNRGATLLKWQAQQALKGRLYLFHLEVSRYEILQGRCKYISDVIFKGFII